MGRRIDNDTIKIFIKASSQFCIQSYVIFLFGFGFSSSHGYSFWSLFNPGVRIFGLITSFLSVLHGINCHIVANSGIKTKFSQTNILKCSLYTLPDLLIRLLFFPISWTLIGGYTFLVNLFLCIVAAITEELLLIRDSSHNYYWSSIWGLGINIAPQVLASYSKHFIWGKIISNPLFLILTIFFNICLLAIEPMSNLIMDTDRLVARFNSTMPVVCNTTSSYQTETFVDNHTIAYIFIPIIYVCIALSSLEIIFHFCLGEKWTKWRDENIVHITQYPEILISAQTDINHIERCR